MAKPVAEGPTVFSDTGDPGETPLTLRLLFDGLPGDKPTPAPGLPNLPDGWLVLVEE